jgi:hypothetical protein
MKFLAFNIKGAQNGKKTFDGYTNMILANFDKPANEILAIMNRYKNH